LVCCGICGVDSSSEVVGFIQAGREQFEEEEAWRLVSGFSELFRPLKSLILLAFASVSSKKYCTSHQPYIPLYEKQKLSSLLALCFLSGARSDIEKISSPAPSEEECLSKPRMVLILLFQDGLEHSPDLGHRYRLLYSSCCLYGLMLCIISTNSLRVPR
jgi:hypothetical protein